MAHKLRHQTFHCCWLALLAVLASTKAHSSTAHIPQPWRSDAVVQGRDEMYNTERFLHELTFRHRQPLPGNSWLHASLILPDYYFNSKTDSPDRFAREDSRRHTGFTGKLALPITTRLSATEQATLTLNPTLYLHKFGFGGGNLQLHWRCNRL